MKKALPDARQGFVSFGSPARTRTTDPVINSHLLYRLSYRGIKRRGILLISIPCVNPGLTRDYPLNPFQRLDQVVHAGRKGNTGAAFRAKR